METPRQECRETQEALKSFAKDMINGLERIENFISEEDVPDRKRSIVKYLKSLLRASQAEIESTIFQGHHTTLAIRLKDAAEQTKPFIIVEYIIKGQITEYLPNYLIHLKSTDPSRLNEILNLFKQINLQIKIITPGMPLTQQVDLTELIKLNAITIVNRDIRIFGGIKGIEEKEVKVKSVFSLPILFTDHDAIKTVQPVTVELEEDH